MRILIAEDDFTSRAVLAGVLRKDGHEVVETVNGTEAWQALQQPDAPRMAILDWMMPEMDGPEVVCRVRGVATDSPPYILLLTAKDKKSDIVAGLDSGADDYLAKPFDLGELRARIRVGERLVNLQDALLKSRESLAHSATHDPLTGLINRRAILDHLHRELSRSGRQSGSLAVGMCDIDHFKLVNDTYGHQTGDDVLCGFSRTLSENIRPYDYVGRIGGEEFLVVAPLKADADQVCLFDRLCARVCASTIATRSGMLSITVSIGVACAKPDCTVDRLLEAADEALYKAKSWGRNRVAYCGASVLEDAPSALS